MGQVTKVKEKSLHEEDAEMLAAAQAEYDALNTATAAAAQPPAATGDAKFDAMLAQLFALQAQNARALQVLADKQEAGPTPQIPFAQAKFQTPWNPTGEKYARLLKRPVFLNGHRVSEVYLSQDTIDLFNQVRPGRYHDRRWTVTEQDGGVEGSALYIWLQNSRLEDRMYNTQMSAGRGIDGILEKIIAEQNAVRLSA